MNVTVSGKTLSGTVTAIASKSAVHRLLICAAFSNAPTVIENVTTSQDIEATIRCLQHVADITLKNNRLFVTPRQKREQSPLLNCGESGSTLRFLLPVIAATGGGSFVGHGRLAERPLSPLYELLAENGCRLSKAGEFPLTVSGTLQGDTFAIDGGVSSQFISGLLLAAPLLNRQVRIVVTGKTESAPYIRLTVEALRCFGVTVEEKENTFLVQGRYTSPGTVTAEGDWSNAAFWLVGAAISHSKKLTVTGLKSDSLQGDRHILTLLQQAGFTVNQTENGITVDGVAKKPLCIDAADIPDMVPIAAVLAASLHGKTKIINARRLAYKESNRLQSVHQMLTALGGTATVTADSLTIDGKGGLRGGTVDACNDHRIAMSAAIASLICEKDVTILGANAADKSYPDFFQKLEQKGMSVCPLSGETI
ncbi:MAG: 3-phosphoshikimate 1-carboxyvinyltransferase [Clostridia bacterium]|nr:3-phosphoshikimate 1-carboxyvinyltransferase [Clostridia bacterium]